MALVHDAFRSICRGLGMDFPMRRVVVTGMGLVTPLGIGLDHVWNRLIEGESGIRAIQSFDVSDLPSRIAGAGAARRPRIGAVQRG